MEQAEGVLDPYANRANGVETSERGLYGVGNFSLSSASEFHQYVIRPFFIRMTSGTLSLTSIIFAMGVLF